MFAPRERGSGEPSAASAAPSPPTAEEQRHALRLLETDIRELKGKIVEDYSCLGYTDPLFRPWFAWPFSDHVDSVQSSPTELPAARVPPFGDASNSTGSLRQRRIVKT
jgi:hypothetical protein